jgi:hypothetical protein
VWCGLFLWSITVVVLLLMPAYPFLAAVTFLLAGVSPLLAAVACLQAGVYSAGYRDLIPAVVHKV